MFISSLSQKKGTPYACRSAITRNLDGIRNRLSLNKKYSIVEAELCYKQIDDEENLAPMWHILVNIAPDKTIPIVRHVWIDALTGNLKNIEK